MSLIKLILLFNYLFNVVNGRQLKSTLTFVIDDTMSMGDDIAEVISRSKDVFEAVYESNSSVVDEFALVSFNDPGAEVRCITQDYDEFKKELNDLYPHGGLDCPEMSMKGIQLALEKSRSNSFVYVFTDAAAKDFNLFDKVKELSQRKSIQVTFLLTGSCRGKPGWSGEESEQVYDKLAEATSGQVFRNLEKYDISKVIQYIIESIKCEKTLLARKTVGKGHGRRITFKVDSKIQDVIISVAGQDPYFAVIDSEGHIVETEEVVGLPNGNVVKFSTTSKEYTLEMISDDDASVFITGSTDVTFEHGFSFMKPDSPEKTLTKPIINTKSYLSIRLMNEDRDVKLDTVELIDLDGNIITTKPLALINKEKQFYSTESFESPNAMYKIQVNGYINNEEPITRIGVATIETQRGQVISVPYNTGHTVRCNIHSSKQTNLTWYRDREKIGKHDDFLLSNDGKVITIKSMKPEYVGSYRCATNEKHSRTFEFILMISGVAPKVNIIGESEVNVDYNSSISLKCAVSGYPEPNITWEDELSTTLESEIQREKKSLNYISILQIPNVTDNTTYYCKAANSEGSNKKPVTVNVKEIIFFKMIDIPTDQTIRYQGNKDIFCKAEGTPPININWYKDKVKVIENDDIKISSDGSVLKIIKMNPNMAGDYHCEAVNKYKYQTIGFQINTSGVEKPKLDKNETRYSIEKGTNYDLPCRIISGIPKPSVSWFKRDNTERFILLNATEDTYKIRNAQLEDIGVYRCKAHNTLGADTRDVDVFVTYPPKIEVDKKTIIARNGDKINIQCVVDGSPFPRVQWSRNGETIECGAKYRIFRDYTLSFTGTVQDNGNYTCEASSALVTVKKNVMVNIYSPVIITSPINTSYVLKVGSSLDMVCQVYGDPKPEIKWTYYSFDPNVEQKDVKPANDKSLLSLQMVQIDDEGYYRCTASNIGGQNSLTYTIYVKAPPSIINRFKYGVLKAVVGDVVLKIPCEVTGNPRPVIAWTSNGLNITKATPGHSIDKNGTLFITMIDKPFSRDYTCQADNDIGRDHYTYEVKVLESPEIVEPIATLLLEEGQSSDIECELPYMERDTINWFKDGQLFKTGALRLVDVKTTESGVYSCRVATLDGSHTFHTRVRVGIKPVFSSEEDRYIDYNAGEEAKLECSAIGVPNPTVVWARDGRSINIFTPTYKFTMTVQHIATYKCNVSNEFGFIIRSFEIKAEACSLNVHTDFKEYQPLILSYTQRWPNFEKSGNFIKIPKHKYIFLYCPGTYFTNPKLEAVDKVLASCVNNSIIKIKDTKEEIEFSKIRCQNKIQPAIESTGDKCGRGPTQLFHVGFHLGTAFIGVYDICYDKKNNISLFTRHSMDKNIANVVSQVDPKYGNLGIDIEDLYGESQQINRLSLLLGRQFHAEDGCRFRKRQLINPRDVLIGPSQVGTYNFMNIVPQWSTCNTENWEEVERRVRSLTKAFDYKLVVWTGVSQYLTLPGRNEKVYLSDKLNHRQPVPKFIWKVVQNLELQASVAIIQINIPDLKESQVLENVLCEDICDQIQWMKGIQWRDVSRGYTYCCSIIKFEDAFNYGLLFGSLTRVFKNIPKYT